MTTLALIMAGALVAPASSLALPSEGKGFLVTANKIQVAHPVSSAISFPSSDSFRLELDEPFEKVAVRAERPGSPSKVRIRPLELGVGLFFAGTLDLTLDTDEPPLLTWSDGSAGPGIPTPETEWVALTLGGPEPPILIEFERPVTVQLSARDDGFGLQVRQPRVGWVQWHLPVGLDVGPYRTAASLGALSRDLERYRDMVRGLTTRVTSAEVEWRSGRLFWIFRFDGSSAMLPPELVLARAAGLPLEIHSGVRSLNRSGPHGPWWMTTEPRLVFSLPFDPIPFGRGLAEGEVSWSDDVFDGAEPTYEDWLSWAVQIRLALLPDSHIQRLVRGLTESATATEAERAARAALVASTLAALSDPTDEEFGFPEEGLPLSALEIAQYWISEPLSADSDRRRAGAYAVHGALSAVANDAARGGWSIIRLAAERARPQFLQRRGITYPQDALIEPWPALLHRVYQTGLPVNFPGLNRWEEALYSPFRVTARPQMIVERFENDLLLQWMPNPNQNQFFLSAPTLQDITAINEASQIEAIAKDGWLQARIAPGATTRVRARMWFSDRPRVPRLEQVPHYEETRIPLNLR